MILLIKFHFFKHITRFRFKTNYYIRFKRKLNRNFHTVIMKFQMHEIDRIRLHSRIVRRVGTHLIRRCDPVFNRSARLLSNANKLSPAEYFHITKESTRQEFTCLKQVVRKAYLWRAFVDILVKSTIPPLPVEKLDLLVSICAVLLLIANIFQLS